MSERLAQRLLIVGWDAADWINIDDLLKVGAMPVVRRLIDQGVRGNLASLEPRLSPLLWTSIATGKTPDQHGILNFVEPNPAGDGLRIASSTSRKTKALWNILTQSGMRTNVVSWYASHPAEPINGTVVSNLFFEGMPVERNQVWPMPTGAVHPESWSRRIQDRRVHLADWDTTALKPFVPGIRPRDLNDGRIRMLAKNLAHCDSVQASAMEILRADATWDCTMVFFETIDSIGHNFMQFHPPRMRHVSEVDFQLFRQVMRQVYQMQDRMLGEMLQACGPNTTLMLLSDHGFYSDHRRPEIDVQKMSNADRAAVETRWHRPLGMLLLAGPGIRRGQRVYGAGLLDIAPTALTLLGLPVGADMRGRALTETFDRPVKPDSVLGWDLVQGDSGMHPTDLRQDPFEAHDALQQLVDLGYMAALPEEAARQVEMVWRETQCNLSSVQTMLGQHNQAVETLTRLHEKYPDEPRFTVGLARSLIRAERAAEAIAPLQRGLAHSPDDLGLRFALLSATIEAERRDEALALLAALDADCGQRKDVAAALATSAVALELWPQAERYCRLALEFDPEAAAMHKEFGHVLIMLDRHEDAVESLLRSVEIVHVFPEAHYLMGIALTRLDEYAHAIKAFEVALSMRPSMIDAHRYLATIHRKLGNASMAMKHRQAAEQLIKDQQTGTISIEFMRRGAPIGPQEWARQIGLSEE